MKPYYADDAVALYHGDCREVTDWLAADVLVTDPPYGVGWKPGQQWFAWSGERPRETSRVRPPMQGDDDTQARDQVLTAWGNRPAIVFGSWRAPRPERVRHLLIWHKTGRQPGVTTAPWFPTHEEMYVLGDGFIGRPVGSVYTTNEHRGVETRTIGHPTTKPVQLMEQLITRCPPGLIADPFAGSGSTLLAVKALGRTGIGVEVDERYCEIAARRLSQGVLALGDAS